MHDSFIIICNLLPKFTWFRC